MEDFLQSPKGTRDFLPEEMAKRDLIFGKIAKIFEKSGFCKVLTPSFEHLEVLEAKGELGGDTIKDIYRFEDKGGRKLGLRFDMTTPLARVVAQNPVMPKPMRWSYLANMWRYERPGKGKYREFWQAGIETIGSSSEIADAEVLAVTSLALKAAGIEDVKLKLNSRKILDLIYETLKIEVEGKKVSRVVDKVEKIGIDGVKKELEEIGVEEKKAEELASIVGKRGKEAERFLKKIGGEQVKKLLRISELAKRLGAENVEIDLSIARGLDYYTGFIFEAVGPEKIGALAAGGRYDRLIGKFCKKSIPATGMSIGLDRVVEVSKLSSRPSKTKVFVCYVEDKQLNFALNAVKKLRDAGIATELGFDAGLGKQLSYAEKRDVPFAMIIGEKEVEREEVSIKEMKSGEQKMMKIEKVIERLLL